MTAMQDSTNNSTPTVFQVDDTKLFVGNLPNTILASKLYRKFGKVGNVVDVYLMRGTNLQVRCAFVRMRTSVEAAKAITRYHHTTIKEHVIVVRLAKPCMCTLLVSFTFRFFSAPVSDPHLAPVNSQTMIIGALLPHPNGRMPPPRPTPRHISFGIWVGSRLKLILTPH